MRRSKGRAADSISPHSIAKRPSRSARRPGRPNNWARMSETLIAGPVRSACPRSAVPRLAPPEWPSRERSAKRRSPFWNWTSTGRTAHRAASTTTGRSPHGADHPRAASTRPEASNRACEVDALRLLFAVRPISIGSTRRESLSADSQSRATLRPVRSAGNTTRVGRYVVVCRSQSRGSGARRCSSEDSPDCAVPQGCTTRRQPRRRSSGHPFLGDMRRESIGQ